MPRLKGEKLDKLSRSGVPHRFEPPRQPPLAAVSPSLSKEGSRTFSHLLWRRSRHERLQENLPKSTVLVPSQVSRLGVRCFESAQTNF